MAKTRKYNNDHIDKLHDEYQNGRSFKYLADNSKSIAGVDITIEDIKGISRSHKWARVVGDREIDVNEMNVEVLHILYKSIRKDWDDNEIADAQKINAFSSLQQKLGDIGQSVSNGKSNLQQILEHLE